MECGTKEKVPQRLINQSCTINYKKQTCQRQSPDRKQSSHCHKLPLLSQASHQALFHAPNCEVIRIRNDHHAYRDPNQNHHDQENHNHHLNHHDIYP